MGGFAGQPEFVHVAQLFSSFFLVVDTAVQATYYEQPHDPLLPLCGHCRV